MTADSNKVDTTAKQRFLPFDGVLCVHQYIGIAILLQALTNGSCLHIVQPRTLNFFAGSHRISDTYWRHLKVGNGCTKQLTLVSATLAVLTVVMHDVNANATQANNRIFFIMQIYFNDTFSNYDSFTDILSQSALIVRQCFVLCLIIGLVITFLWRRLLT